jgi:hypothetical protein
MTVIKILPFFPIHLSMNMVLFMAGAEFEDTKGVIRSSNTMNGRSENCPYTTQRTND